jgi:hypothetical protein
MTSRLERRVATIERLQAAVPKPPLGPRVFVAGTLVGFYRCNRREDEHPLAAFRQFLAASGFEGFERSLQELFATHGCDLGGGPTPEAVAAMQQLLDGVPERWRDADLAWWPTSAIDMWTEPGPQISPSDRGAARIPTQ